MELKNQMKSKTIVIENIKKYFNKKLVLDIEKLEFMCGEVTYIVGENGAGKSTLLNIIADIDDEYNGKILGSYRRDEISLVDANPYMLKGNVFENIKYPLEIRKNKNINNNSIYKDKEEYKKDKKESINKKVEELMKIFDVNLLKDKKASKLSSGETQKVAILRALSFEPKLLLLDEPTANLDKETKLELIELVKEYKNKGNTVIIVTHDLDFFKNLEGKKVELKKLK